MRDSKQRRCDEGWAGRGPGLSSSILKASQRDIVLQSAGQGFRALVANLVTPKAVKEHKFGLFSTVFASLPNPASSTHSSVVSDLLSLRALDKARAPALPTLL